MNEILKVFLSMSFSGALLILALLLGGRLLKNKISRQWQYYIWLIVILRLVLPFGTETSLMGKMYQDMDDGISQAVSLYERPTPFYTSGDISTLEDIFHFAVGAEADNENAACSAEGLISVRPAEGLAPAGPTEDLAAASPLQDIASLLINHIWIIWLAATLGMVIRKVTIYQSFIRYIKAGLAPVADMRILDQLPIVAEQAGVKKPVELCVNPLVSSPMLIGFFHPCIVLPGVDISEKDFRHIVLHELTHYKRGDMFYKWLVQITVCLHWFNPFVYLMGREIAKACEFSCDEAVLAKIGYDNARGYGETLLGAMAAIRGYKENLGVAGLSENKQLLKERLGAIMDFKRKSKAIRFLTVLLTLGIVSGASFIGVYAAAAPSGEVLNESLLTSGLMGTDGIPMRGGTFTQEENPVQDGTKADSNEAFLQMEQYYSADSLPLFGIAFSRLDESEQKIWLEKLYANEDFAFFSVAVSGLGTNSFLFADFAQRAYDDGEIGFFSILADCMDETKLESWLDQALEDGKWNFQSVLFDRLERGGEFDELEEKREREWDKARKEEYQSVGVTIDGKNYYYQGQLVNIFLDIRANKSLYTLNMNPAGTVNIKIIRDADDKIADAAYMTEAEVIELLEDKGEPDDMAME
jgi:beta-lactamase regulating signal transducer with metallopeptidase domain